MKTTVIHTLGDSITLRAAEQTLFTYVYESQNPAVESPRPYFHPLKTLAGNTVSLTRPHDHLWHTGLSMTSANLSGENFWGGRTYVRGSGYTQLENNGRVQHANWSDISGDDEVRGIEHLRWITHAGAPWIDEERHIIVREINSEAGYWCLELSFSLLNSSPQPLAFGSPTTEGRTNAGYGGLFWRGPRSFLGGQIVGADGLQGPEMMGTRSPWLAFIGRHDENDAQSTLLFIDHPTNPRYPNKWFVRNDPYACVSCSFMFDEYYMLPPHEMLKLVYRVVFANGAWPRTQIEHYIKEHTFE